MMLRIHFTDGILLRHLDQHQRGGTITTEGSDTTYTYMTAIAAWLTALCSETVTPAAMPCRAEDTFDTRRLASFSLLSEETEPDRLTFLLVL